jgi:molecular chaperone GrpE
MFSKEKHKKNEQQDATVKAEETGAEVVVETPEAAPSEPQATVDEKAAPAVDEVAVLKDRYARLMADFDNFRKRQVREREEWLKRANEGLLGDFLPVVDHLELALKKVTDPNDSFSKGIQMVYDQFIAMLAKHDVTPIDAKGEPFNPDWHEALSQMPSETVPEHVVIEQFRRGWALAGRLLRPAQVIVSSGKPEPTAEA